MIANLGERRGRRPFWRRITLLAIAGAGLLVLGFYTTANAAALSHNHLLGGADWAGYAFCHRITARSFAINGRQFSLCARCTGMYLGVALTFVVFWLAGRLRDVDLPRLPIILALLGFLGLMGVDGLNSLVHFFPNAPHLYEPRNWLRLVTGTGAGLAMGGFVFPALGQTLWRQREFRPVIGSFRELGLLVAVALTVILLLLSNLSPLMYVLSLVSVAGLLLILTALNAVFLLTATRRDGQATKWRETAVPLLVSFTLAVIEISAISLLRYHLTGTMTGFPGVG